MSEETTPSPSLRLKPRLRPETAAESGTEVAASASSASSAVATIPEPATPAPSGESFSLKLRPRANVAPTESILPPPPPVPAATTVRAEATAALAASETTAPSSTSPSPTAAQPSVAQAATDAPDLSRLKLKPRVAGSESPAAGGESLTLPPPPTLPQVRTAPPMSGLTEGAGSPPLPPPLPPLQLPVSQPKVTPPAAAAAVARPENTPAFRTGVWVVGALLVCSIGGVGFLGYKFVTKDSGPAPVVAKSESAPAAPAAAESTEEAGDDGVLARAPESTAGKLIAKAQDAVAARENSHVEGVEEVLAEASPDTSGPARSSGGNVITRTPADAPVAAEPVSTAPREIVRPPVSTAFKAFVVNMRVSGVFQGEPGRAFLNGKMYHVGEMLEPKLGIRFAGLDADRKTLYFEDKAGALMPRRY